VLASDEESARLDALRFSLADEIVELVVVTSDQNFLQTLREAMGGARRLWHVPSVDKVSDLLVAGEVGILVLDVQSLIGAPSVFVGQVKRQFPDLVVVVAGSRDAEISLAGLISAGIVYRFIHKPMSPGRAKLFADAAVKKYDEQRRRAPPPRVMRASPSHRGVLIGAAASAVCVILAGVWALRHGSGDLGAAHSTAAANPSAAESPLIIQAAAALAANKLTGPAGGDSALDLYLRALAQNPNDPVARAGVAEVRERLLATAENALLEERLDQASAAIETARKSGVESGRIAFLTAQLVKSREHLKAAQAAARARSDSKSEDKVTPLLTLAAQRSADNHLIDPDGDSALFYVQEALKLDPNSAPAQDAEGALAIRLLSESHGAIDRRDFTRASQWIDAAKEVASAANVETAQGQLEAARRQADTDAWTQLLKNGNERLQQDRLIEPKGDSAKYYLLTLQSLDPGNIGLGAAMQELGSRLVAKARLALTLGQYEAARSWLDEAAAIGYASPDSISAQRELDAVVARRQFLANVVDANDLSLVKSVPPVYPKQAELAKTAGWVELDFTIAESGAVKEIAVNAASVPGVFEDAAISALSQWQYKPVLRDAKAVPQRARIRIHFVVAG